MNLLDLIDPLAVDQGERLLKKKKYVLSCVHHHTMEKKKDSPLKNEKYKNSQ